MTGEGSAAGFGAAFRADVGELAEDLARLGIELPASQEPYRPCRGLILPGAALDRLRQQEAELEWRVEGVVFARRFLGSDRQSLLFALYAKEVRALLGAFRSLAVEPLPAAGGASP